MNETIHPVNGINGDTGEYLPSPFADAAHPPRFYDIALHPAIERERRWLCERYAFKFPDRLLAEGVDPLKLPSSGWGVIFAPNIEPATKEALRSLLTFRKQQAGDYYKEFAYSADTTTKVDFLSKSGAALGPVDPKRVPYYLLVVGDPESVPYRFQYELDVQYAVGRIHFDAPEDYARYAQSVVEMENGKGLPPPQLVTFFSVRRTGDKTTEHMTEHLIRPLVESLSTKDENSNPNPWPQRVLIGEQATKAQLGRLLGGDETPALLITACHGVGFSMDSEKQRIHQGALVCQDWPGPSGEKESVDPVYYFAAHDVRDNPRLKGLIVVHFACYSAGTPKFSDFDFQDLGRPEQISEKSFVSNLSQRLLSGGALAVLGHIDRSWTSSFSWIEKGDQVKVFEGLLKRLMKGHPVGSAMEYINQQHAELSVKLSGLWADQAKLAHYSQSRFNRLWQANNDARNFVVVGDPAVRLVQMEHT